MQVEGFFMSQVLNMKEVTVLITKPRLVTARGGKFQVFLATMPLLAVGKTELIQRDWCILAIALKHTRKHSLTPWSHSELDVSGRGRVGVLCILHYSPKCLEGQRIIEENPPMS
jgi:hypothetical protein